MKILNHLSDETKRSLYLSWLDNHSATEQFAEELGLDWDTTQALIDEGRILQDSHTRRERNHE